MKTGEESNKQLVLEGISTKLDQLQEKLGALSKLLTVWCSYEKYHDDFIICVMPDGEFNLTFRWFCYGVNKYLNKLFDGKLDTRDHELILREQFKQFDLLIQKEGYSWEVTVSTPVLRPSVKCITVTNK